MKKLTYLLLFISCNLFGQNDLLLTQFEQSDGTETATYEEIINYYTRLASRYPEIELKEIGLTDSNKPLQLVTYTPKKLNRVNDPLILLINNGIHPGESDGIDATMMLYRDLATGRQKTPRNTIVMTIPVYNVGGCLNRNSTSRTNQNGPKAYGFRGNAQNYDLNRDFIKADTRNARSFAQLFSSIRPDVFIDNHVSNGADYQYTLTHLFTQHNRLGGDLGDYLHQNLMPQLENNLAKLNWPITPYVNVFNRTPDAGFSQFMDSPRYSTGYTTLYNTLGMMVETHMLKPYKDRVEGTFILMQEMLKLVDKDADNIKKCVTT